MVEDSHRAEQVVSAHSGDAPSRDELPAWGYLILFFAGLTLFGAGLDVMTSFDMPAFVGAPVCIGSMTFGALLAVGSLGCLIEGTRDSDGSPKGGDGEAGSVHDSAGRNGIAPASSASPPAFMQERGE